jgi:cold shock CspA family protein
VEVRGIVAAFNEQRGDGVMLTNNGESLYFHCVAIADGTRTIAPGTEVIAQRVVGHLGSDEVISVEALR